MQLKDHHLWWKGPQWLLAEPDQWPEQPTNLCVTVPAEERDLQPSYRHLYYTYQTSHPNKSILQLRTAEESNRLDPQIH